MTSLTCDQAQAAAGNSESGKRTVLAIGEGLLAEMICGQLSAWYKVVRRAEHQTNWPEADLVVWIREDEHAAAYPDVRAPQHLKGVPWLRCLVAADEGVIGPLVRPGAAGCFHCADQRRLIANRDAAQALPLASLLAPAEIPVRKRLMLPGLAHVSRLTVDECRRVLSGQRGRLEDHIYIVNLGSLESSLHFILPDPLCEACGQLPDDSPLSARIVLEPRIKAAADSYRSRPAHDWREALARDYSDPRTGVFNAQMNDLHSPFAVVNVNMPSFIGDEVAGGRSHSYAESELTAMLEGLERRCGLVPRGKRTVVRDSYRKLADQALDPVAVGLYRQEQYAQPDFPFEPFDPDRPLDWVWGYSLLQRRPLLVPECLAYYSLSYGDSFVQEGSNGCALGGSLEEAIFYGLLEVAERDAFLMTWYAQLPLARLDPHSSHDLELSLMLDKLKAVAGYEVHLFDMTTENRIPGILALAKSEAPGTMRLICAAAAHPDPVRAAKSAIHELAGLIGVLNEQLAERLDELQAMLRQPDLVMRMEDHALLNGLPQAEERFSFLLDERRPMRSFAERFPRNVGHADLTEDLNDLLQTFRRLKLDVIVIDQTSSEIARNQLYCVKVLVPGMLPMTFGHPLRRLNGLERVLRVPAELGYMNEPLAMEQLNPHPHPFI